MTVILVDPRRPSLVPVEAVELLGGDVQYTEEMPVKVPWSLPSARPVHTGEDAPVLLSSDREHPEVRARLAAGERLISVPAPQPGERLVDAVAIMDRLRTAGPWESEQTHDSLRRYLLEETYELFDAVHGGNADELREELGDVLLQVLFHARIAEEALAKAFSIDDVADTLVRKLGNRVPAVLAGESISLEDQIAQWEQRKALEKAARVVLHGGHSDRPARAVAGAEGDRPGAERRPARRSDPVVDHHRDGGGRVRRREHLAHRGSGVHGDCAPHRAGDRREPARHRCADRTRRRRATGCGQRRRMAAALAQRGQRGATGHPGGAGGGVGRRHGRRRRSGGRHRARRAGAT